MQTVKVKALRPFMGQQGMVQEGQMIAVSVPRARELARLKLATELVGGAMKGKRGEGAADPTSSHRAGSPIGVAKTASSSVPDPAPNPLTSDSLAGAPDSSPSTIPGRSRRGRRRSTAATSTGGTNTPESPDSLV